MRLWIFIRGCPFFGPSISQSVYPSIHPVIGCPSIHPTVHRVLVSGYALASRHEVCPSISQMVRWSIDPSIGIPFLCERVYVRMSVSWSHVFFGSLKKVIHLVKVERACVCICAARTHILFVYRTCFLATEQL